MPAERAAASITARCAASEGAVTVRVVPTWPAALPGAPGYVTETFCEQARYFSPENGARIDAIRKSTGGLVTDMEAMQAANKAMLLDLGLTDAQMGDLAATATVLGRAMGQDANKSLDDLITALGRSSPMILDNLGITVNVSKANEVYAKTLGKSADALTDAEKKQAFMNAALTAAAAKA